MSSIVRGYFRWPGETGTISGNLVNFMLDTAISPHANACRYIYKLCEIGIREILSWTMLLLKCILLYSGSARHFSCKFSVTVYT